MVLTDGRRGCLEQTMASFLTSVTGPVGAVLIVNDSLDPGYAEFLQEVYGAAARIVSRDEKLGFCGAVQLGWSELPEGTEMVFHLEDDFTFNRPLDLLPMAEALRAHPRLVQLALRRQPWSEEERLAGGVVEVWPEEYESHWWEGHEWLEHRLFFTTNPSLYRVELTHAGWPDPPACEAAFTGRVLEDPGARFAYWGTRFSGPWVHHIGDERAGGGY